MDQDALERDGLGFRCRCCGITVLGDAARPLKLCTACQQDLDDPAGWVKRRTHDHARGV
jgi:hypothetical protein